MSVTKKQVEEWITELGIDWRAHDITKQQLIDAAYQEDDPRAFLEGLVGDEDASTNDHQQDPQPPEPDAPNAENNETEEPGPQFARQGATHRPVCPIHKAPMKAGSTQGPLTYYYCQAPGCSHSESVPRINMQQFMQRQGERAAQKPQVDPRI